MAHCPQTGPLVDDHVYRTWLADGRTLFQHRMSYINEGQLLAGPASTTVRMMKVQRTDAERKDGVEEQLRPPAGPA